MYSFCGYNLYACYIFEVSDEVLGSSILRILHSGTEISLQSLKEVGKSHQNLPVSSSGH